MLFLLGVLKKNILHNCIDPVTFQNDSTLIVIGPEAPESIIYVSCLAISVYSNLNWDWEYEGIQLTSGGRYQVQVSNDRRNSTLVMLDGRYTDSGNYTCQVSHPGSSKKYRKTKELILESK